MQEGRLRIKTDPLAFATEVPPANAAVVHTSRHEWADDEWLERRRATEPLKRPVSIYEVHLGSWRRNPLEGNRLLNYLALAVVVSDYVRRSGLRHARLQPRPKRGATLPAGERDLLAPRASCGRGLRRRGRLDALPRLLAAPSRMGAAHVRRARGSRCRPVPQGSERDDPR